MHIIHITYSQIIHTIVSMHRDDVFYPHCYPQVICFSTMPLWVIRFSTSFFHKLSASPHHDSCTVTCLLFFHKECGKLIHNLATIYRRDAHYPHYLFTNYPHYRLDISRRCVLSTLLSTGYPLLHIGLFRIRVIHILCG